MKRSESEWKSSLRKRKKGYLGWIQKRNWNFVKRLLTICGQGDGKSMHALVLEVLMLHAFKQLAEKELGSVLELLHACIKLGGRT
jgi:hypothetical protein